MDLFSHGRKKQIEAESPLANRMRPQTIDEYVGQTHIIGPGRLLRRAIQADQLSSLIFYGPPGTGKTTLAMVIANSTQTHFITINAVLAGVKEIREAIADAEERRNLHNQRTTLFVDEVHRWNKAQQDALLPHVEKGTLILIGATTENPYFSVNKALVSRSRIFQLKSLTNSELRQIAIQALKTPTRGYAHLNVEIEPTALDHLVDVANGDARGVLNALELAVETTPPDENGRIQITLATAEESIQQRAVLYDKDGDTHYDTISAFIKSIRGSDPDAALYWMAKMIYAGEDPNFIFRRMGILASEDIGMANPNAVTVVNSCWALYERIGLPEGRFHLSQAALYLATSPKSNTTLAFFDALTAISQEAEADVPNHLKDPNRDGKSFGHGANYLYPHAYRDHWVAQQYLPTALQGKLFYQPSNQGYEKEIQTAVSRQREAQLAAMLEAESTSTETLTFSPPIDSRDAWLQRTINQTGSDLAELRDQLFSTIPIERHHLILELNSAAALLSWEAFRQTPEGAVWLQTNNQNHDRFAQLSTQLPELERPQLISTPLPELRTSIPSDIRFDWLLARNLFTQTISQQPDKIATDLFINELINHIPPLLAPHGRIAFLQIIPQHNQRLYQLLDRTKIDPSLLTKLITAEELIYQNPQTALLSWDETTLKSLLSNAGFDSKSQMLTQTPARRITDEEINRWFSPGPPEKPSYLDYLTPHFSAKDLTILQTSFRQQLGSKSIPWQTKTAFIYS